MFAITLQIKLNFTEISVIPMSNELLNSNLTGAFFLFFLYILAPKILNICQGVQILREKIKLKTFSCVFD